MCPVRFEVLICVSLSLSLYLARYWNVLLTTITFIFLFFGYVYFVRVEKTAAAPLKLFSQVLLQIDLLVLFRSCVFFFLNVVLPFLFILVNSLRFALMYACSRFQGARIETLKLNFDY